MEKVKVQYVTNNPVSKDVVNKDVLLLNKKIRRLEIENARLREIIIESSKRTLETNKYHTKLYQQLVEVNKKNINLEQHLTKFTEKNGDKCTICLETYNKDDVNMYLTCSHKYHAKCVNTWLNIHNSCPICRNYSNID